MAIPYLEYTMSVNNIKRPVVVQGKDGIYVLLARLALLDPGTNQAFPTMGLGLRTRWRYALSDSIPSLINEYRNQISTFLPGLNLLDLNAELKGKTLIFKINIDNTVYPVMVNTEDYSLEHV